MKYVILGKDNKEYGPIDAETLKKWVEHGRVLPSTMVRNALLKKWNKAESLDFLEEPFAIQEKQREEEEGVGGRFKEMLFSLSGGKKKKKDKSTAFRYTYLPDPASAAQRTFAWLFDMIIIGGAAACLALFMIFGFKAGFDPTRLFHMLFAGFVIFLILYYGVALGVFAQTIGMWFWGIMLARRESEEETAEAYMLRAYAFTIAMFVFGVISPLLVYLNPKRRAIHDMITGCVVVRIAAKPKA